MQWLIFPLLPLMVACHISGLLPLTDELIGERLYTSIIVGNYDKAVTQTIQLEADSKGQVISQVVNRLLAYNKRNIIEYAYQLWIDNETKQIVENYFPVQFKLIVNENYVELLHKGTGDLYVSLLPEGQSSDVELSTWMFIPFWENNRVYFKLKSVECSSYIYLSGDDHLTYGSIDSDTLGHQWYLQPINQDNDVMFFIYNREFDEALGLKDVNGDGKDDGHGDSNNVEGRPDVFGWFIVPSDHQPELFNCFN